MHTILRSLILVSSVTLVTFPSTLLGAVTEYHVRPLINIVGETIDGLKVNGDTSNNVSFGDVARDGRASADLGSGQLRSYNEISGTNVSQVTLAEFSETLTIRNASGTSFSLDFDLEGDIYASDEPAVPGGSPNSYFVTANLAVFAGDFAEWDTWFNLAYTDNAAIFADTFSLSVSDPGDVDDSISELLSYSTTLASDDETFHVFARIQLGAIANTFQTIELDFENTATLGFEADPAASVFSNSGAFPDTMLVPEPAGTSLLMVAAGLLFGIRRRGRQRGC